jgi:hypothetical protein
MRAEDGSIRLGVYGHPEVAMIVISHSNKPEGLKEALCRLPPGGQHLRHSADRTGLGLEGNFYKVAVIEGLTETQ